MRSALCLLLVVYTVVPVAAQRGEGRPDISWYELSTPHFTVVYHEGLDSIAREAGRIAEAVYPVVTGNLGVELPGRTPMYLSDLDDVPNALAHGDEYMYIWLRGILDDMPLGGVRSAGTAKWLRTVITHEFTHTVISHATQTWLDDLLGAPSDVPRWFHEGTARFMEPDGWTSDLDMVLRVAAVNGRLGYGESGRLDGHLLYETGHALVRYMVWRFGDTVLANIVNGGRSGWGRYNFLNAVRQATGESFSDIYRDWYRTVTVLYGTHYGVREETGDIAPPLTERVSFVDGLRFSPDASRVAFLGGNAGEPVRLALITARTGTVTGDSGTTLRLLSRETGFDREFSWSPDGTRLVLAKYRYGAHDALVHDLYLLEVATGELTRLTDNAALSDPAWSPDGRTIVAVHKRMGRDRLVAVDPATGAQRPLLSLPGDVQMYTPAWSPDGTRLAFSLFDADGRRSVAVVSSDGTGLRRLTTDTANNRYPVWSPDGTRLAFTSHTNGVPNVQIMNTDGSERRFLTDVAGGVYTVQWKPGSDSVLVISFDSRDRILPHLLPATRSVKPVPVPVLRSNYGAWRSVALPRQVPVESAMPAVPISEEGGYCSIAHLGLRQVYPLVSSDNTYGSDVRSDLLKYRVQLVGLWRDPMNIHEFSALVDMGMVRWRPGGFASYTSNALPVSVVLSGGALYGFTRTLAGEPLYEWRRTGGIGLEWSIADADALAAQWTFRLGGEYRSLEPSHPEAFTGVALVPVRARLVELTAGCTYASPTVLLDARYRRSDRSLGATHDYDHLTAVGEWALPLSSWTSSSFVLRAEGTALWGEQVPQEFVGLDAWDQFEGGFNVLRLEPRHRVRGVRRTVYGDRVFVGSAGLRQTVEEVDVLVFAELGTAWFAGTTPIADLMFDRGYGIELQYDLWQNLRLTGGIAFEMKSAVRRDVYLRVVRGL